MGVARISYKRSCDADRSRLYSADGDGQLGGSLAEEVCEE